KCLPRRWCHPPVRRKKKVIGAGNPALQPDGTMAAPISSVGVVGAGQMGNGIAQVCALAGYSVALNDVSADRIKAAMATINGHMARQVGKKTITEDQRK